MKSKAITGLLLAAAYAAGFFCVWQLQRQVDATRASMQVEKDELTLHSPGVIKKLSLEYAPLMGALYWTRAVQYYGEKIRFYDSHLQLLWPMLDIATTLDPNLIIAYRFGAIFLGDPPSVGAGEPDHAITLLERGIQANPEYWRLYQDLGNIYYFYKKDYLKASDAYLAGSKIPGAQPWMKIMAAKIAAEGESLETSYALWLDIYQTTTDKNIHKNAEKHLKLVKAEMDLRRLNLLTEEYKKRTKRSATSVSELVQAKLLTGLPRDPEGVPYILGEDGTAEINPKSGLREDWLKERH